MAEGGKKMRVDDLFITEDISVLDAMRKLDETGLGVLFVAPEGVLRAVVTDGDIRRYILKSLPLEGPVREAANYSPYALPMEARARAKTALLEHGIGALPLLDKRGRVQDVVFAGGLDIDTHKKACAPVVIMAGGLGTRLYPYTKILPKPLIPIGEMPIVEHIIHRFADVGCSAFTMIVNYKKSMIKSYFNDLQKDYTVDYVDEDTPLGTGGGLSLLKGKVTQTFFLTNCDILIDADFGDIYQYHKEKGNVITGDHILYIYGCYMKERGKLLMNTVVTTVMSNFGLYKAFDEQGIGYAKTAVGDKYVYEYMAKNGCRIGGEQSGHIIFSKYASTGDGILTSLKMMEVMLAKKKPMSELAAPLKIYPQVLKNVKVTDKKAAQDDADVQAAVKAVGEALGDTGRILVRESGTEPLVRVMVEAPEHETCEKYVQQVVDVIKAKGYAI